MTLQPMILHVHISSSFFVICMRICTNQLVEEGGNLEVCMSLLLMTTCLSKISNASHISNLPMQICLKHMGYMSDMMSAQSGVNYGHNGQVRSYVYHI